MKAKVRILKGVAAIDRPPSGAGDRRLIWGIIC